MVKKRTPSAPSVSAVCGNIHLRMKKERNRPQHSAKTVPFRYDHKAAKYRPVNPRRCRRRQAVLRPRQKSKSIHLAVPHMLKRQKRRPSPQQPAALQSRLLFSLYPARSAAENRSGARHKAALPPEFSVSALRQPMARDKRRRSPLSHCVIVRTDSGSIPVFQSFSASGTAARPPNSRRTPL